MKDSPGGSGRVILLVALLLVTCYVADWTDDYSSYTVFTQSSAFQSANGFKPPVSGGSMASSTMLASFGLPSTSGNTRQISTMETVFGSPLGSTSGATDDSVGRASASGLNSFS